MYLSLINLISIDQNGSLITCTTLVDLWSQIKLGKLDGGPSNLTTLKNTVGNLFSESLRAEQYSGSSTRRMVNIHTSAYSEGSWELQLKLLLSILIATRNLHQSCIYLDFEQVKDHLLLIICNIRKYIFIH